MADVWFTADTHFRHAMLVERGHRPFGSIAEHDAALIERWNRVVRPGDQVWHLGDWAMGPADQHLPIVAQLHGDIHLITGNHDRPWPANRDAHRHQAAWIRAGFASVQAYARRRIRGRQVLLSHFPYRGDHTDGDDRAEQYRLRSDGVPLLHGHVHDAWTVRGRQVNVGVDVHQFAPVHLDTVAGLLPVDILTRTGMDLAVMMRASGRTWKQIADEFGISPTAVRNAVDPPNHRVGRA